MSVISTLFRKEVRALLPTWAACTSVLLLAALTGHRPLVSLAMLSYGLGVVALGAQSIGHEYSHRTLGVLLAQPIGRRKVYLVKLGSLFALVAPMSALTAAVLIAHAAPGSGSEALIFIALAAACSLFLAPTLTIAARGALGGTVFTIGIVGVLMATAETIAAIEFGTQTGSDVREFKLAFLTRAVVIVSACAAAASWLMFVRLQVIDGRGPELRLPAWRGAAASERASLPSRPQRPVWVIVKKELRLQSMTVVLAGAYIALCALVSVLQRSVPALQALPVVPLTIMYTALLSVVIGAMASAEERQLGTHQWHLLLPMGAGTQWLLKAAVVLVLALVLGLAIPAALTPIVAPGAGFEVFLRAGSKLGLAIVLLAAGSLYVSSLSGSGVKAMAFALPFLVCGGFLSILASQATLRSFNGGPARAPSATEISIVVGFAAATVVAWLLRLGLINHRHADRTVAGTVLQLTSIAVLVVAASVFTVALLNRG